MSDNGIIRSPREKENFTKVYNDVVDDKRLKPAALGLLVYLLSKPDTWVTRKADLRRRFGIGSTALETNLKMLRDIGYIKTVKYRDNKGRWSSTTTVYDLPKEDS